MTTTQLTSILVQQQQLTTQQRDELLHDAEGFSHLDALLAAAAERFHLESANLIDALSAQIAAAAPRIRLSQAPHDPEVLAYVPACDAWDYLILPLAFDEAGQLICCTTEETLQTSLAYLLGNLEVPFTLVLSDVSPLEMYIAEQYHYEGLDVDAA